MDFTFHNSHLNILEIYCDLGIIYEYIYIYMADRSVVGQFPDHWLVLIGLLVDYLVDYLVSW